MVYVSSAPRAWQELHGSHIRHFWFEGTKAYLEHPWLSGRLYELCVALLHHKDKSANEIFGDLDAMKLKSSMTLFALTSEDYTIFDQVLDQFFDGEMDEITVRIINES